MGLLGKPPAVLAMGGGSGAELTAAAAGDAAGELAGAGELAAAGEPTGAAAGEPAGAGADVAAGFAVGDGAAAGAHATIAASIARSASDVNERDPTPQSETAKNDERFNLIATSLSSNEQQLRTAIPGACQATSR
jgi:hypothetical protein